MSWPSTPPGPPAQPGPPTLPKRPVDVDTGFWLWLAAVPLIAIGYLVDLLGLGAGRGSVLACLASGLLLVVVCAIVVTFLILMRAGYRWARTVLSGGGLATIVYVMLRLFSENWPPAVAVACAFTDIIGSVLIAGGMFVLHRRDAHAHFSR